jgi:hypothetical protein
VPRRRRRALTIKAFADQHRIDIQDVRAAIRHGSINTLVIGKTVLIPNTESARLLRKAYAELSIMAAGSPGAVPTSPIASRPAALKSDPPSNSWSACRWHGSAPIARPLPDTSPLKIGQHIVARLKLLRRGECTHGRSENIRSNLAAIKTSSGSSSSISRFALQPAPNSIELATPSSIKT